MLNNLSIFFKKNQKLIMFLTYILTLILLSSKAVFVNILLFSFLIKIEVIKYLIHILILALIPVIYLIIQIINIFNIISDSYIETLINIHYVCTEMIYFINFIIFLIFCTLVDILIAISDICFFIFLHIYILLAEIIDFIDTLYIYIIFKLIQICDTIKYYYFFILIYIDTYCSKIINFLNIQLVYIYNIIRDLYFNTLLLIDNIFTLVIDYICIPPIINIIEIFSFFKFKDIVFLLIGYLIYTPQTLGILHLSPLIINTLIIILFILIGGVIPLLERKYLSLMQRRIGPKFVGYNGRLQFIADAMKLLLKELILLHGTNKFVLVFLPIITLTLNLILVINIIFLNSISILDINIYIFILLIVELITVIFLTYIGFLVKNKYTVIASTRLLNGIIVFELFITIMYLYFYI